MEKEIYYKVYNGKNSLLLVTPKMANAVSLIEELTGLDLSEMSFGVALNGSRFVEGYRVSKIKI